MTTTDVAEAFEQYRRLLLALSYRLTGNVEDAEEAVQETFARALAKPPARTEDPWKPWLIRVATNLSLDALRRRKRRAYVGPWLPSPLSEADGSILDPAAQYEMRESATLAFLVALETLSTRQRAALVLKEAFELSAREIGAALQVSEGSARMLLHRAREAMRSARPGTPRSLRSLEEESHAILSRLLELLTRHDLDGVVALLAEDVQLRTDSGGRVTALAVPMVGARPVATLLSRVAARRLSGSATQLDTVNGLPALWVEFASTERRQAPRALIACDLDERGAIRELFAILDPHKLARVRPVDQSSIVSVSPR